LIPYQAVLAAERPLPMIEVAATKVNIAQEPREVTLASRRTFAGVLA
jgi:hypothetical protein